MRHPGETVEPGDEAAGQTWRSTWPCCADPTQAKHVQARDIADLAKAVEREERAQHSVEALVHQAAVHAAAERQRAVERQRGRSMNASLKGRRNGAEHDAQALVR